jgi:hypothetical protein
MDNEKFATSVHVSPSRSWQISIKFGTGCLHWKLSEAIRFLNVQCDICNVVTFVMVDLYPQRTNVRVSDVRKSQTTGLENVCLTGTRGSRNRLPSSTDVRNFSGQSCKRWSDPATCHRGAWGERRYSSYSFLNSALDGCEWSASRLGRVLPRGEDPRYPLNRRLGGPQSRAGRRG